MEVIEVAGEVFACPGCVQIRYVLIPGLTDSLKDVKHLERLCRGRKNLQVSGLEVRIQDRRR
mgnify:CR=1 FL=1